MFPPANNKTTPLPDSCFFRTQLLSLSPIVIDLKRFCTADDYGPPTQSQPPTAVSRLLRVSAPLRHEHSTQLPRAPPSNRESGRSADRPVTGRLRDPTDHLEDGYVNNKRDGPVFKKRQGAEGGRRRSASAGQLPV